MENHVDHFYVFNSYTEKYGIYTHWNININAIIMILSIIFNIVLRRYLLTLLPFQILSLLHFIDLITSCVYLRIVCVFYRIMCAYRIVRVSCVYRIVCVYCIVCISYCIIYVSYVYSIVCVSYLVEIRIIKYKAWTMWQYCIVFNVKNSLTGTCT